MAQLSDDCFAFGGALLPVSEMERLIAERVVPVTNGTTIPHTASAVLVNLACNTPAAAGFLAMWQSGVWPGHSNLNFAAGGASSNNATSAVVAGTPSTVKIRASTTTHVVVDVLGYYP